MPITYPIAADTLGDDEICAAKAVLDSRLLTLGERVRQFEAEFAAWTGARHAVMVNSGSSGNLLMIDLMLRRSRASAPWKSGDEVLVPALAWPTTVWPLVQLGLVPVFVDVDPSTLAIDLQCAEAMLGPRVRGMVLIEVLGRAPDLTAYVRFCNEHGLTLLEDSCESMGSHSHERHVGTVGLMGSFSLYFSHHLSTIEGGFVVTNDDELFDDLISIRSHGWIRDRSDAATWRSQFAEIDERFLFIMPGYNVRPTEIQAAIGSVQLKKLDQMLAARETLARQVHRWVAEYAPWLELIGSECLSSATPTRRSRTHSWMMLPFRLNANAPLSVSEIKAHFEAMNVATRPIIAGNLVRHPAVRNIQHRTAHSLAVADDLLARGFMLGCHPVAAPGAIEVLHAAFQSLGQHRAR